MIRAIFLSSRNKFITKKSFESKFSSGSKEDKSTKKENKSNESLPSEKSQEEVGTKKDLAVVTKNKLKIENKRLDELSMVTELDEDLLNKLTKNISLKRNKILKEKSKRNEVMKDNSKRIMSMNSEFDENLFHKSVKDVSLKKNEVMKDNSKRYILKKIEKTNNFDNISYNNIGDILKDIGYKQESNKFEEHFFDSEEIRFLEIDSSKRLNIFNKDDFDSSFENETYNIMDIVESWEYKQMTLLPPQNQFEEWIMLTKDKKLWKFPIDNFQDSSELNVGFHEHVFPQQYLSGRLPTTGIVSQYMNLVVLGLSQSPHLTVSKKKEHIKWYEEYFASKLDEINIAVEKSKEQQVYEDSIRKNKI